MKAAKIQSLRSLPTKDVSRIFAEEGHLIDEALGQGVREAIDPPQVGPPAGCDLL
jgi:hypothetical protein